MADHSHGLDHMAMDKLDLSTLKKVNNDFLIKQVQEHMRKFPNVTRVEKVVSCYRLNTTAKRIYRRYPECSGVYEDLNKMSLLKGDIQLLYFPVWILLALIPEEEGKCLTIGEIVVSKYEDDNDSVLPWWFSKKMKASDLKIGNGSLKVEHLTVVCKSGGSFSLGNLRSELSKFGAIECVKCTLKVFIDQWKDYSSELRKVKDNVGQNDELKLVFDVEDGGKDVTSILPYREDLIDIPLCSEGYCESNHTMFMPIQSFLNIIQRVFPLEGASVPAYANFFGDGILIATLGYGYDRHEPWYKNEEPIHVLCQKNFASETAPVYDDRYTSPWIINKYTKRSSFVVCQTTYCDGTIANGATAKAIKWLREEWKEKWWKCGEERKVRKRKVVQEEVTRKRKKGTDQEEKARPLEEEEEEDKEREDKTGKGEDLGGGDRGWRKYDNLVILIPYGGQYMEDEMREIYGATDEGIIIVCAAGRQGGGVVFPAALGTVISVGVAGNGPRGREVDICVVPGEGKSGNSGVAAAWITGLLCLLLARLNSILESTDPVIKETAKFIKRIPRYLHTCVIRELLVNEGTGSHDPQRGYGNGEEIFRKLFLMNNTELLKKLTNIHFKESDSTKHQQNDPDFQPISEQTIKHLSHYDLDGNGVTVAVIDYDFTNVEDVEYDMGASFQTSIRPFVKPEGQSTSHGDRCAAVVNTICPQATILCVNDLNYKDNDLSGGFKDCSVHDPSIDIISYSISLLHFDFSLCQAVNQAVVAGKIIVFAAGNAGQRLRNTIGYPGRIGNVLVIGGRDRYYTHLSFSSVGREMDFLAPADLGRSYVGTSFAAPSVAGYIALLLQFIKRMDEKTDEEGKSKYNITAWSKNPDTDDYEWQSVPIYEAAHNVYAMRALLKALLSKPQAHSDREGFGCLDFSVLFPSYRIPTLDPSILNTPVAERIIHKTLQSFYKRN